VSKVYFDVRDVAKALRLGFSGKKMALGFVGVVVGYIGYAILCYLALSAGGYPFGELWARYRFYPCVAGTSLPWYSWVIYGIGVAFLVLVLLATAAGSQYWWPTKVSYDAIFYDNETEAQDTPDVFAITDANDPGSVTGSATSDGAQTGGECTLTDSTKQFTSTDLVYARDIVHNITDDSDGIVLEVVSDTELKTALFDGKSNQWSSGDEYRIERSGHKQITFDAPCSTAGHIVTVPYVCMPQPVFSSYRNWRFPASTCRAVCMEAAYLYASQKEDFAMADRLRAAFAEEVRRYRIETARSTLQGGRYSDIGIYRTRL